MSPDPSASRIAAATTPPRVVHTQAPRPRAVARAVPRPAESFYIRIGRPLFDVSLAALLLVASAPVLILVTAANALLFGSLRLAFFVQPRAGRHRCPFRLIKFRTMRDVATDHAESWRGGAEQARVTRFGRFLRSTHLDELPQLFNVLRGDMSMIGPRPEMLEIEAWAGEHIPGFSKRLVIKPGITGLAQITQGYTGNDIAAYARKLEINLDYLRRMSFALDLSICARTAVWMLRGRGWAWKRGAQ